MTGAGWPGQQHARVMITILDARLYACADPEMEIIRANTAARSGCREWLRDTSKYENTYHHLFRDRCRYPDHILLFPEHDHDHDAFERISHHWHGPVTGTAVWV